MQICLSHMHQVLLSAVHDKQLKAFDKSIKIAPANAFIHLCLPVSLFPSTFPINTWYSIPLCLSTCPKKLNCLLIICFINCLSVCAFLNTFHSLPSSSRRSSSSSIKTTFLPPEVAFSLLHLLSTFHIHASLYSLYSTL